MPFASYFLGGTPVGQDYAGVVIASRSANFPNGSRVFGTLEGARGGCAAEELIASAANAALIPADLSFAQAAALVTVSMTAIQAFRIANLQEGQRVLVVGATGGCGSIGVQVARAIVGPSGRVASICSGASAPLARSLGSDVVADYKAADPLAILRAEAPFDAIFDTVSSWDLGDDLGGIPYTVALRPLLKKQGLHVAINGTPFQWIGAILGWQATGYRLFMQKPDGVALQTVVDLLEKGMLRPLLDSTYPFSEEGFASAFSLLKSRRSKGKVVVVRDTGNS
jgi:NADPH:quinone reductase-like Zn-dependent oxidoreductase